MLLKTPDLFCWNYVVLMLETYIHIPVLKLQIFDMSANASPSLAHDRHYKLTVSYFLAKPWRILICARVLINTVLEKATTISSELANVKLNCHYYANWFVCVSSYVNSLNSQGYQNFGKTCLKIFNVTKIEYIIFPDWFGL